jgi:acyl transferase domain-containing protein
VVAEHRAQVAYPLNCLKPRSSKPTTRRANPARAVSHAQVPQLANPNAAITIASLTLNTSDLAVTAIADRGAGVALLYPGQGAQYPGMARSVYEREPTFRVAFDRCAECCGLPLARLAFDGERATLDRTDTTQPAIFAIEYALTAMLRGWGVRPAVVLGHSVGEYAAACTAGMLTVEEACHAVTARGRLMQERCEPSAMVAIDAPEEDLRLLLRAHPDVELAVGNTARSVVVGGSRDAAAQFRAAATRAGLPARSLPVSHAFHTRFMDPMLETFAATTRGIGDRHADGVTFLSSSTGGELEYTNGRYWVEHVRRPVRFAEALRRLGALMPDIVVEVGPGRTLIGLAQRELGRDAARRWVALLASRRDEHCALMRAAAELWLNGAMDAPSRIRRPATAT